MLKMPLSKETGLKVLKGAGIAMLGALLTYITDALPNVELGVYAPLVMGMWSIIVNFGRKWVVNALS